MNESTQAVHPKGRDDVNEVCLRVEESRGMDCGSYFRPVYVGEEELHAGKIGCQRTRSLGVLLQMLLHPL